MARREIVLYFLLVSITANIILSYYHYLITSQNRKYLNEIARINTYLDLYEKQIARLEKSIQEYNRNVSDSNN